MGLQRGDTSTPRGGQLSSESPEGRFIGLAAMSAGGPRLATLLTRPEGVLARIRWLFLLFALFGSAGLGPLLVLISPSAWLLKAAACSALVWLCLHWMHVYWQARLSFAGDIVEGLALLLVGVTVLSPVGIIVPALMGLCFRSLYGSWGRVMFGALVYCGAFLGALALSPRAALRGDRARRDRGRHRAARRACRGRAPRGDGPHAARAGVGAGEELAAGTRGQ